MYGPYLTMAEIEAKYPDEWVFVANPKYARGYKVLGGHVVFHAPNREDFYRLIRAWEDPAVKETASWYTGEVGEWLGEILPPETRLEPGAV